jgi:hypothetical protein
LRWINAARVKPVQTIIMDQFTKPQMQAVQPDAQPNTVRGLATVAAAWPSGVSPLAQAVDACQRRDARETALVTRAANSILLPAVFSPNGRFFAR